MAITRSLPTSSKKQKKKRKLSHKNKERKQCACGFVEAASERVGVVVEEDDQIIPQPPAPQLDKTELELLTNLIKREAIFGSELFRNEVMQNILNKYGYFAKLCLRAIPESEARILFRYLELWQIAEVVKERLENADDTLPRSPTAVSSKNICDDDDDIRGDKKEKDGEDDINCNEGDYHNFASNVSTSGGDEDLPAAEATRVGVVVEVDDQIIPQPPAPQLDKTELELLTNLIKREAIFGSELFRNEVMQNILNKYGYFAKLCLRAIPESEARILFRYLELWQIAEVVKERLENADDTLPRSPTTASSTKKATAATEVASKKESRDDRKAATATTDATTTTNETAAKTVSELHTRERRERACKLQPKATYQCHVLSAMQFFCNEDCSNNKCKNKYFDVKQKRTVVKETTNKGKAVFSTSEIKKNDIIMEYKGESITKTKLKMQKREEMLFVAMCNGELIDARMSIESNAKYINHSCLPNCELQQFKVDDKSEEYLFIIAKEGISRGRELTFDYQWKPMQGRKPTECHCGETVCRGTIEL